MGLQIWTLAVPMYRSVSVLILTDAALLKPSKNEIEKLQAKLHGSHSEHLEEEISTLWNTLLQSERQLEEEKRAQAEGEKVLQEQAKKIKIFCSMFIYSSRDENRDQHKKQD